MYGRAIFARACAGKCAGFEPWVFNYLTPLYGTHKYQNSIEKSTKVAFLLVCLIVGSIIKDPWAWVISSKKGARARRSGRISKTQHNKSSSLYLELYYDEMGWALSKKVMVVSDRI